MARQMARAEWESLSKDPFVSSSALAFLAFLPSPDPTESQMCRQVAPVRLWSPEELLLVLLAGR
jgi:hypothetical protein